MALSRSHFPAGRRGRFSKTAILLSWRRFVKRRGCGGLGSGRAAGSSFLLRYERWAGVGNSFYRRTARPLNCSDAEQHAGSLRGARASVLRESWFFWGNCTRQGALGTKLSHLLRTISQPRPGALPDAASRAEAHKHEEPTPKKSPSHPAQRLEPGADSPHAVQRLSSSAAVQFCDKRCPDRRPTLRTESEKAAAVRRGDIFRVSRNDSRLRRLPVPVARG